MSRPETTPPRLDPLMARALALGLRGLAADVRSGALDPRTLLGRPVVDLVTAPAAPKGKARV